MVRKANTRMNTCMSFTMRVLHCMSSKGGNEVFTHLHLMMVYYSTNFFFVDRKRQLKLSQKELKL